MCGYIDYVFIIGLIAWLVKELGKGLGDNEVEWVDGKKVVTEKPTYKIVIGLIVWGIGVISFYLNILYFVFCINCSHSYHCI